MMNLIQRKRLSSGTAKGLDFMSSKTFLMKVYSFGVRLRSLIFRSQIQQRSTEKKYVEYGTKEYDKLCNDFIEGSISFEEFTSSTLPIPRPPRIRSRQKRK